MMVAFLVDYDVLAIPASWDCFHYKGWLYRRGPESFYREKWIGQS